MKKIASLFILSLFALGMNAQNAPMQGAGGNWQPVILNAGGSNISNGVEATYLLGNDVVVIRLVNHTTNTIKATWKDAVITTDGKRHTGSNNQESVTIAPKIRVSDDDGNTVQVTIKLSDFQAGSANFKSFGVSDFEAIANQ